MVALHAPKGNELTPQKRPVQETDNPKAEKSPYHQLQDVAFKRRRSVGRYEQESARRKF